MLTLYWYWSYNPQKVRFALEELGLDYSLVTVDLLRGGQHADLVGELNPNHKVPILSHGPYSLWESNAILVYLGELHHRLWPGEPEGKGDAARWLFFESRHLSEPLGQLWFNGFVAGQAGRVPDTLAMERAQKDSARYLGVLDSHLEREDWMVGGGFSLVDCCYGPLLDAFELSGSGIEAYPAIRDYLRRLRERRAWKACAFRTRAA